MTFTIIGDDPKLATILDSSDYHYSITDKLKVLQQITLATKETIDNSVKPSKSLVSFQFQYLRPNTDKLRDAIGELCQYIASKGATLERIDPPEPAEPETRPFDQEKSNFYGQNSVTQPYHTPAQIAAAAQGTLPVYQLNNHGFHQNGGFHHHNIGSMNGYHNYAGQSYGRGGYSHLSSGSFGHNRAMNAGRGGHHNPHSPPPGYQNGFSPFQAPGRGGVSNHGHFNPSYGSVGGAGNGHINSNNGFPRARFAPTPPTPSAEPHVPGTTNMSYPPHPRSGGIATGMVVQSPLDTLSSLDLPEINNSSANGNGADFRAAQDAHTPLSNPGPFSPPPQSYFPPQQGPSHHNNYSHGYSAGSNAPRFQG
jgi:hypothetical protein